MPGGVCLEAIRQLVRAAYKDELPSNPLPPLDPGRDRHLFVRLGRMSRGRGSGLTVMLGNGA